MIYKILTPGNTTKSRNREKLGNIYKWNFNPLLLKYSKTLNGKNSLN